MDNEKIKLMEKKLVRNYLIDETMKFVERHINYIGYQQFKLNFGIKDDQNRILKYVVGLREVIDRYNGEIPKLSDLEECKMLPIALKNYSAYEWYVGVEGLDSIYRVEYLGKYCSNVPFSEGFYYKKELIREYRINDIKEEIADNLINMFSDEELEMFANKIL